MDELCDVSCPLGNECELDVIELEDDENPLVDKKLFSVLGRQLFLRKLDLGALLCRKKALGTRSVFFCVFSRKFEFAHKY